jgi:putative membrane protein
MKAHTLLMRAESDGGRSASCPLCRERKTAAVVDPFKRTRTMEILMRNTAVIVAAALASLSSISLALAKSDSAFLTDAIQGNLSEISIGELAQKNGASEGVKSFGQMLVQDHSTANEKAMILAKAHSVTPPTEPKAESKSLHDRLAKLSGEQFDKEFAKAMVEDHKKDIKEFEDQAKGADDVASFAKDTVPTLKKHLQTAQSLMSQKSARQ